MALNIWIIILIIHRRHQNRSLILITTVCPTAGETARGLNPNSASDATGDYQGKGYNNIEYYSHDLTIDSFPKGTVTLSPELTPTATPKPTAAPILNGNLIKSLTIKDAANAADWSIQNNLQTGDVISTATEPILLQMYLIISKVLNG